MNRLHFHPDDRRQLDCILSGGSRQLALAGGGPLCIGLVPGSFSPPHLGHVELATLALDAAPIDFCLFYANSFNRAKRGALLGLDHRCRMLESLLAGKQRLMILSPGYHSDNPGDAYAPQEVVFDGLMSRLRRSLGRAVDFWLIRGSDNFCPIDWGGYAYPSELADIPHVIGIRTREHADYDYSALAECRFVHTSSVSSADIRRCLAAGQRVDRMTGADVARYLSEHGLTGTAGDQRRRPPPYCRRATP